MTVGGDFAPSGDRREYDTGGNYPTVFGIRLTPPVSGILIALLGLGASAYLLINLVQPTWQRNQELRQDVAAKESQLVNREDSQRRIQEARAELAEARQLRADVVALFANQESIDTLLLDLNERIQAVNAGIQDEDRRANLTRFELNEELSGVITDSSLGTEVNNRIERRVYDVELEGDFPQTQSIMRNIERLQPLLVVKNLNSELDFAAQSILIDAQGRLLPNGQPVTRITTSFQLQALVPVENTPAPAASPPAAGTTEGGAVEGEAAN
jgi:type IV pilus assembly protein PilO